MENKKNLIKFIKDINNELNWNTQDLNLVEENNVSELHIHKMLFIIYGAFYKKFNKELFEPNFAAWKYGPVELDYRKFAKDGKKDLINKFNFSLQNNSEENYLKKLIQKLLKFSPWSLVEYTHSFEAWINNYDENNKLGKKISKEDIFESFKDKNFE